MPKKFRGWIVQVPWNSRTAHFRQSSCQVWSAFFHDLAAFSHPDRVANHLFFSTMSAWRFNAISVSLDKSEWAFYLPICRNGQQIVPPNLSFTGFPLHGQCALGCRGHAKTQPLCGLLKSWAASFKYSSLYSHQRTIQVSKWVSKYVTTYVSK